LAGRDLRQTGSLESLAFMLPRSTLVYTVGMSHTYTKPFCQSDVIQSPLVIFASHLTRPVESLDLLHLIPSKSGSRVSLSSNLNFSSTINHVLHISLLCPRVGVFWIDTVSRVTGVASLVLSGVFSSGYTHGHSVSQVYIPAYTKESIPVIVDSSRPEPAPTGGDRYLGHESGNIRFTEGRNWFMLSSSHLISFQDRLVRAARDADNIPVAHNLHCITRLFELS